MSDLEHKTISEMLTKYAITANGVALSVSLVALAGIDNANGVIKITSTPFWFFFIGMIFAGLFALLRLHLSMAQESVSIHQNIIATKMEIDEQQKAIEAVSQFAIENGSLTPEIVLRLKDSRDTLLKHQHLTANLLKRMEKILEDYKPNIVMGVRHAQEICFSLSYLFLMLGIYSVINSIQV